MKRYLLSLFCVLTLAFLQVGSALPFSPINPPLYGGGAVITTWQTPPSIAIQNTPPGTPSAGNRYIVGTAPTGVWVGHANAIADYTTVWNYTTPQLGYSIVNAGDNSIYVWSGSAWANIGTGAGNYVPITTTINGHQLNTNVTISASDVTTGTLPGAQLPNPSATTLGGVESIAGQAHKWIASISTTGVPSLSQPAFADLSGTPTTIAGYGITDALVYQTTTVNGHALSANVTVTAADVGLGNVQNVDQTNASNITSGTLGAARLPNPSGTTLGGIKSLAQSASKWVYGIDTLGNPLVSQPAFSDISGTIAGSQLPAMSSGAQGAVPATGVPSGKVLSDNGTWITASGSGNVTGPGSSTDSQIALFNGTAGTQIKASTLTGILKATSGVPSAAVAKTDYAPATSGSQALAGDGLGGFAVAGFGQLASHPTTVAGYGITDAVPASLTINGHALTGNVTVSASDITTGTLPGAQLPNPGASSLGGIQSVASQTSKWISSISTLGVPVLSQPTFADLASHPTTSAGYGITDDLLRTANDFTTFTQKVSPSAYDVLLLEDSASGYAKKYVTIGALPTGGSPYWTTIASKPSFTVGDVGYGPGLSDALTAIGSTQCTLIVPKGVTVTGGGLSIPTNVNLKVEKGGLISVADGTQLTINGSIEAGPWQVFSRVSTGVVYWGNPYATGFNHSTREVSLRWFGCKGDGTTNDTAAFQWALDSVFPQNMYVGQGIILTGCPTDVYVASNLFMNGYGWSNDQQAILDLKGATIKLASLSDPYILKASIPGGNTSVRNIRFKGTNTIWKSSTTIASAPSSVTIDGNTCTEVGSIIALDITSGWNVYRYYYDAGAQRLYVSYYGDFMSDANYPGAHVWSDPANVKINGTTQIYNWTKYRPVDGLFCYEPFALAVNNIRAVGLGCGLHIQGSQFSQYRTLFFEGCDQALLLTTIGGGSNNIQNTLTDIFTSWIDCFNHNAIIEITDGSTLTFDGVNCSAGRGKSLLISGGSVMDFRGFYTEGNGWYLDATEDSMMEFNNCRDIKFSASEVSCGLDTGGFNYPPTCYTEVLKFVNNAQNIKIEASNLSAGSPAVKNVGLYSMDATVRNIEFNQDDISVTNYCTGDAIAKIRNCSWGNPNQGVWMNVDALENIPYTLPDYSLLRSISGLPGLSYTGSPQVAVSYDGGNSGYLSPHPLKFVFTGINTKATIAGADAFTSPPTGYWLQSVYYKSTSPIWFVLGDQGGPSSQRIYSPGDGKWRIAYWFTNATSAASAGIDVGVSDDDAYWKSSDTVNSAASVTIHTTLGSANVCVSKASLADLLATPPGQYAYYYDSGAHSLSISSPWPPSYAVADGVTVNNWAQYSPPAYSKTLWLDGFSLKSFDSIQTQMNFIGKTDLYPGDPATLPTGNWPSMTTFRQKYVTLKTANGSGQLISGLGAGAIDQIIDLEVAETNTSFDMCAGAYGEYTHVYTLNNTTWSADHYIDTAYNYFANTPTVNDCIYFGGNISYVRRFNGLAFDVGTANTFVGTFIWEYWNGSSWATLSTSETTPGTCIKSVAAPVYVKWLPPSDWVHGSLSVILGGGAPNVDGFWVRLRLSAYTSGAAGGAQTGLPMRLGGNLFLSTNNIAALAGPTNLINLRLKYDVVHGLWKEIGRTSY